MSGTIDAGNEKPYFGDDEGRRLATLPPIEAAIPMDVMMTPKMMFAMRSGERVIVDEGDAKELGLSFPKSRERLMYESIRRGQVHKDS